MKKADMLNEKEYKMGIRAIGLLKRLLPKTELNHNRLGKLRNVLWIAYADKDASR